MKYDTIRLNPDDRGVMTLTLYRPEKHNALSANMIREITGVMAAIAQNPDIRVVVLEGSGKSFCAGGDLEWMRQQMTAPRDQRIAEARKLAEMLKVMNELPKPLIGKIHGNAFGGGVGIISVCDVALCSKDAKFGLTETKLGLIPATISPYVIARLGGGMARRVFMSARIFNSDEANELGLVSKPVDDLDEAIETEISAYLATSPKAVAAAKALARSLGPTIDASVIDATIERLADTWETPEAVEGVSAFFEKRKPIWRN